MLDGLDSIHQAHELLLERPAPVKKRLLDAGAEFLLAAHHANEWPGQLRRDANRIKARLLSGGDLRSSIETMDESALDEIEEDLLLFTKAAHQYAACCHSARAY